MRIDAGQDFNIWYFIIALVIVFYTFNSWQGTQGYQCCAKDPHEAKNLANSKAHAATLAAMRRRHSELRKAMR